MLQRLNKEIDYYAVLNIPRNATSEQIALAYRKIAINYHPKRDINNDHLFTPPNDYIEEDNPLPALSDCERWFLANKAYEILANPLRRSVYDHHGEKGLQNCVPLPNGFFTPYFYHRDCLKTYQDAFGSASPYASILDGILKPPPLHATENGFQLKIKDEPITKNISLSLEEIFFGTNKTIKILRQEFIDETLARTEIREKFLKIVIPPGTLSGTSYTFLEEGDREPSKIPADLIFVVEDLPHERFYRKNGSNLFMNFTVNLKQALCGFTFVVNTLDKRNLCIAITDVISPSFEKIISGEGLPAVESPKLRGDLIVKFNVVFPTHIRKQYRIRFSKLFNEMENNTKTGSTAQTEDKSDVNIIKNLPNYCN